MRMFQGGDRDGTAHRRRRNLLGLEPIFEGGWLHKGKRAQRWDVEDQLVALALFGDVTVDLAQPRGAPAEIDVEAWAILRDVDVIVPEGTHVELTGRGLFGHLANQTPALPAEKRERIVRVHGHTLASDVTVRVAKTGAAPSEPTTSDPSRSTCSKRSKTASPTGSTS